MKKIVCIIGIVSLILSSGLAGTVTAQIINGAFKRTDIQQKKPMPLPYVREADVLWSKMIWRIIDVREKINQPLYFPSTESNGYISLASLLLKGIESEEITAYDARTDDEFTTPLTKDEIRKAFGVEAKTEMVRDFETGEMEERVVEGEVRLDEIKQFIIKEEWYFDKQNSRLQVRIIGICPIREYLPDGMQQIEDNEEGENNFRRSRVFWVNYSEARPLFARHAVFNPYNNAHAMSYDDLFLKRYFNGYIIQESNQYNNRLISQYMSGKNAMLESKIIEDEIFNYEQDLWEY